MQKNADNSGTSKFGTVYKKDIILVAVVLAAALILAVITRQIKGKSTAGSGEGVLEITIDGELYGTYPLREEQEINVVSSYGRNTVIIEQNTAYVSEADCPDKICEGMQKISHDGEIICCLPHRLFLTVRGTESAAYDAVVY